MADHKVSKVKATVVVSGSVGGASSHIHGTAIGAAAKDTRVSHIHGTAIGADTSSFARVSHIHSTALINAGVDFSWCDVFIEERFPTHIRYSSEGGPGFPVLQQKATSGKTQRVGLHDEEQGRWNVGFQKGAANIRALRDFVVVVGGPEIGFRFKDHMDFSTAPFGADDKLADPTRTDQLFGTGDAATAAHQLKVTRVAGASSRPYTIYKPIAAGILISQDGLLVTNYTLDPTTGVITWTPRATVTGTDISFVDLGGADWIIRSTSTSWAGFVTGEEIRVTGSASNDTAVPLGVYTITGAVPGGSGDLDVTETLVTEAAGASITVDVHPYPRTGVLLKWGGLYDKPVHIIEDAFPIRYVEGKDGSIQAANLQLEELVVNDPLAV